ncbi:MAG TPA: hypothetical protein VK783_11090 [Bacteroidia bacterium]|jgi:hypothetical protein|nr:hypothetical protein [Bacteroidia bacterium]
MKELHTEECQFDYIKSIIEKHEGRILESLPATLKEKLNSMTDSTKEKVLETEYNVQRLHGVLKKFGWLRNWVIQIPPEIRIEGPSEDYPGLGRILLDIENYISIKGPNLKKLGIDNHTYVDRPLSQEVTINGFNRSRYEVENMLVRLGYAEKHEHKFFWKTNAGLLKTDESAIFHILNVAGRMNGWCNESLALIKKMFRIKDIATIANNNSQESIQITPITNVITPPVVKPKDIQTTSLTGNIDEKAESLTKNAQAMLSEINQLSERQMEDADRVASLAQELSDVVAEIDMLLLSMQMRHKETGLPNLKIVGKLELPAKPVEVYYAGAAQEELRNSHYSIWESPTVKSFRITEVSPRKRGAPGQFYKAVAEEGKLVSLLGFDTLTMLNSGESIKVNTVEKISKNGQHTYYTIWPLDESDGQEY